MLYHNKPTPCRFFNVYSLVDAFNLYGFDGSSHMYQLIRHMYTAVLSMVDTHIKQHDPFALYSQAC